MTNPNGGSNDERREPIGSIRIRWRPWYSVLFVAQALPGIAFIFWAELSSVTNDSPVDTVKAIIWGITLVVGASIATTVTLSEVQDIMMGTRDLINDWLQKRNKTAEERGVEIGEERGEKRGLTRAQVWYNRQQAALKKGEPFDEPPPWDDKS